MHSERGRRQGSSRSGDMLNNFGGFGSNRSMFPSLFSGRDPFDDPFFSRPTGDMFQSSTFGLGAASSDLPQSGNGKGIIVEELSSDDEGDEDENDHRKKKPLSSKEPYVEHPDDVVEEAESKKATSGSDHNKVQKTQPNRRSSSVQTCRVTYGGVDGAYYTTTKTRRAGSDGVMLEETKEADTTTGQATHKISRGIQDKGHSVTRKLNSDGKVDMLQTLHNLDEDELAGFEEAWNGNVERIIPSWRDEFDLHGNSGEQQGTSYWSAGLLPSSKQVQSSRAENESRTNADGRTKKVIRINIE